jgi:hypothetical protein
MIPSSIPMLFIIQQVPSRKPQDADPVISVVIHPVGNLWQWQSGDALSPFEGGAGGCWVSTWLKSVPVTLHPPAPPSKGEYVAQSAFEPFHTSLWIYRFLDMPKL